MHKGSLVVVALGLALAACRSHQPTADLDSSKAITSFGFTQPTISGVIDEPAHTIAVQTPFGTDLTALVPSITYTGAELLPAANEAQDFTAPVVYTVVAEDRSTQDYTVTVTVAPPRTSKAITAFSISADQLMEWPGDYIDGDVAEHIDPSLYTAIGDVDEVTHTIFIALPHSTLQRLSLRPTVVHDGASVSPQIADYRSPVTLTVTAEDGSTQNYQVDAEFETDSKALTAFWFSMASGQKSFGVIDEASHSIVVDVPFGSPRRALVPYFTHSGASVSPPLYVARDFSSPATYTVTAADASTQDYVVTVNEASVTPGKLRVELVGPAVLSFGVFDEAAPEASTVYDSVSLDDARDGIEIAPVTETPVNIWVTSNAETHPLYAGGKIFEGHTLARFVFSASGSYALRLSPGLDYRLAAGPHDYPVDWDVVVADDRAFGDYSTDYAGALIHPEVHLINSPAWSLDGDGAYVVHRDDDWPQQFDGEADRFGALLRLVYSGEQATSVTFDARLQTQSGDRLALMWAYAMNTESTFEGANSWASPDSPYVYVDLRGSLAELGLELEDIERIDLIAHHSPAPPADACDLTMSPTSEITQEGDAYEQTFSVTAVPCPTVWSGGAMIFADSQGREYFSIQTTLQVRDDEDNWTDWDGLIPQDEVRVHAPIPANPRFTETYEPSRLIPSWRVLVP